MRDSGCSKRQGTEKNGICSNPRNSRRVIFLTPIAMIIATGVFYRVVSGHLSFVVRTPIKLPVPLNTFPYEFGSWKGEDVPLSNAVIRAARNDEYLNRAYINSSANERVNVYVSFTARPRTMLGHRPTVCYPASGWVSDGTIDTKVTSLSGRIIPCLLHRFHRPAPETDAILVLNYYIVNGEITSDESIFSSIFWRTPNIKGDPARYVAQVQISSASESTVRAVTREMSESLMNYFPRGDSRESNLSEIK